MDTTEKPRLRYREDGTFTILQISDVQDTGGIAVRTKELIQEAIRRERPDLIVLSGDQIKGYGLSLVAAGPEQRRRRITRTLDELLALVGGVPFTMVFGNHDHDAPMPGLEQILLYQRSPFCLTQAGPAELGFANHVLEVAGSGGDKPALLLYLLDSHHSAGLGYQPLLPEQVDWYRRTRDAYSKENGGRPVPSLLFQHVPVEEIIELYREVPRGTPGALEGYRNYNGRYFVLDESKAAPGSFMGELPSSPDENAGLFEAAREKGEMLGMFFGHDHTNGFHGEVRGMQLGYAPGVGYNAYGPGRNRGARVIRLREADPVRLESYVVTDEMLFGPGRALPPAVMLMDNVIPTSFGAAKPLVRRSLATVSVGAAAAAGLLTLGELINHARRRNN